MRHAAIPLLLMILFRATTPEAPAEDPKDPPVPAMTADEMTLMDLVNAERVAEKLPPLKLNLKLQQAARGHSDNMARQNKLEHVLDGKTPSQRVVAVGYDYRNFGENIAYVDGGTQAEVVKGWMDSKPHRENILKKEVIETGLAISRTSKGELYITQVFAAPRR